MTSAEGADSGTPGHQSGGEGANPMLELENRDVIPALKAAVEPVFTNFTCRIKEGKFMKTEPSLVDYCKYGPDADKEMLGLADPNSKSRPVIIQGTK